MLMFETLTDKDTLAVRARDDDQMQTNFLFHNQYPGNI